MKTLFLGLILFASMASFANDCKKLAASEILAHHSSKYAGASLTEINRIDERTGLYSDERAGLGYRPLFEIYKAGLSDEGRAALYLLIYKNSPSCKLHNLIQLD